MLNKFKPAVIILLAPLMVLALSNLAQASVLDNAKQQKEELKQNVKTELQAKKDNLQAARAEQLENRKASLQKAKETIAQKKDELKTKISAVKDEAKKKILEKVYNNINALNERLTKHYVNILNRIEVVLKKIETRAQIAKENGRNVVGVETAITTAKNAILTSRTAIDAQTQKTYELQITTENALRNNVGVARKLLQSDLTKVRQTVAAAHQAVKNAAVKLAQIAKVDELKPVENQ